MLQSLVAMLFSWLPAGLWLPVFAVISTAFLVIAIKLLTIVFDFLFKFIDIFIRPCTFKKEGQAHVW